MIIDREALAQLLEILRQDGYQLVGPTVRDRAIVFTEIDGIGDLPEGITDVQEAGRYRLAARTDKALFGYAVGPHSWKQFFFLPTLRLWSARRDDNGVQIDPGSESYPRLALIGARSCDLHAIAIQDKVFLNGPYVDPDYAMRRQDVFVVAVNCAVAGGTCFCVSMQTGPKATIGFDLALTEVLTSDRHQFLVKVGSAAGQRVIDRVPHAAATANDLQEAEAIVARTADHMGRQLDTTDIRDLLAQNLEHSRWDEVAGRCLGCTNCTLVCPTCFCSQVEDLSDLAGSHSERVRTWDSCFTLQHSYVHGGSVRQSTKSRYRQWLTHKLGTWIDQFGTSGCVGCGRCITWCPVGIDITEEVAAIRTRGPARTQSPMSETCPGGGQPPEDPTSGQVC